MPKIFEGTPQNPTRTVWRIQHKDHGRGPYVDAPEEVERIMAGSKLPSPQSGLVGSSWTEEDIRHLEDPTLRKRFAFDSIQQMRQSIKPHQLRTLEAHGYHVVPVQASQVWGGDNKQVFFSTPEEEKAQQAHWEKTGFKEFRNIGGKMTRVQPGTNTPIEKSLDNLRNRLNKLKKTLRKFEDLNKAITYKKVPQGSCTCGAHKIKSEGHYDWCDGLKPADGRRSMKELCQNYVFHQGDSVSPTGRVLGDHEVDDYIKRISDHFGSEEKAREYLEANYQDTGKKS